MAESRATNVKLATSAGEFETFGFPVPASFSVWSGRAKSDSAVTERYHAELLDN